jgi:hypothetical protein
MERAAILQDQYQQVIVHTGAGWDAISKEKRPLQFSAEAATSAFFQQVSE